MKLRPRARIVPVAFSVAVSFLTVCGAGAAAASPSHATGSPVRGSVQWAYGTVSTVFPRHQGILFAWDATATFGFAVVLGETVGPSGTYTVYVNRTMGLLLSVHYCRPDCSTPVLSGTVSFHAWETTLATLGLTSHANVSVSGTPTPALGISSSDLTIQVGLTEANQVSNRSGLLGSLNVAAFLNGTSTTTFSPALGLVPLTLAPPETWTNSSTFHESGTAAWSTSEKSSGLLLSSKNGERSNSLSFARSGSVSLAGSFNGSTVRLGGSTYDVLALSVSGPFTLREGYLLVPDATDLFGSSAPAWLSGNTTATAGSAVVSGGRLDVGNHLLAGSHIDFGASGLLLASQTSNPAAVDLLGSGGSVAPATGPAAAAPAARAANSTFVQGSPESIGQATTDQNCLANGLGCPGIGSPRLPFVLLAVVAAAVVATLLVLVVAERRRLPPPPYPNATLYPPGGSAPPPPGQPRRPIPEAPPVEDDPLGHLW